MSAKNAIYIRQNQKDCTWFQQLHADASIFNTSRSRHAYGNQIQDIQYVPVQMEHMHIYSLLLGTLAYIGGRKTISTHACESDLSCDLKPDHNNRLTQQTDI